MNGSLMNHWNQWFADQHETFRLQGVHTGNDLAWSGFSTRAISGELLSIPANPGGVSGDIHCLSLSGDCDLLTCLLLDISGHGPAIAALSECIETPLKSLLDDHDNCGLLTALNKLLVDMELAGQFATAVAATFDTADGMWRYAYAGHPNMLLFENGSWCELSAIGEHGIPAGIVADAVFYQYEYRLKPGERLLLYTDGATDICLPTGGRLGIQGLVKMLDSLDPGDPKSTLVELMDALVQVNTSEVFVDDLTLLLLEMN
jgi:serine phosphatase RsbU (regulator of sigma subunit)